MRWQKLGEPDESKPPFDGAHVLVADETSVSEARYLANSNGWWLANTDPTDYYDGRIFPTHWQPMPAPPTQES